ncbi:THO complex subunit 5-like isoform X2 [Teleopsis dalmanni]|nr:THO complex subunit 5-like isoform X2 [Teleopsis dalmanni]XP_037947649.1 THO complex subunit 5-like isoform X2 [Teleopsis dalmanni]XP_037947650.1 THO complex subunit 5-like isoform X2 [Teleopsis dalmanni]
MTVNMFGMIKKLNREIKYNVREGRVNLGAQKQSVDGSLLHLQNLLYEINHLKKQIRHCYEFKSQDEDLDLLEDVKSDKLTSNHKERIACLEKELQLRKELSGNYKELLNRREEVIGNINLKHEKFSLFAPSLQTLLKATKPLHEALEMNLDVEWKLGKLVHLLPEPLYLAYINIYFIKMEPNSNVNLSISGTEEDAFNSHLSSELNSIRKQDANISQSSNLNNDDDISTSNIHMEPHPLAVCFTIGDLKNIDECFTVTLRYFDTLGVMTANSEINYNKTDEIVREISSASNILDVVSNNDGETIPSFEVQRKLKSFQINPTSWLQNLQKKGYGKPYKWLQKMCYIRVNGIQNWEEQKTLNVISNVINKIKKLWQCRLILFTQLKAIVNNKIFLYTENEKLPPGEPSCSLVKWTSIDQEDYYASFVDKTNQDSDVKDSNSFYRALIVKGSAKMECLISLPLKFPFESPLWSINISWNGQHNATNNSAIKLMEYWTNSLCQEQLNNEMAMLSMQLLRTMYSFDIFLETEGQFYDPKEYKKEKHYNRSFSKRIRARPYRYIGDSFKQ